MYEFEGRFFDGKSSAGIPVKVTFGQEDLILSQPEAEEPQNRVWDIRQIHRNDFNDREMTVLQYGDYPYEYLEVASESFLESLRLSYPDAKFTASRYDRFFANGYRYLIVATLVLAALVGGIYFFVIPPAAEMVAASLPAHVEKSLGNSLAQTLLSAEDIDSAKTAQAQHFFRYLYGTKGEHAKVTVVDHSMANAFAVPGGHIIIYKPIIGLTDSYEEFAALLAHEYAHVQHRHSLRALFRNLSSYLVLSALFSDVNGVMAVIIENGDMLKSMEFSRELEREADMTGLDFLINRRINPQGMVALFQSLKEKEGQNNLPEFISTHPMLDSRMKYLKEEIANRQFTVAQHDSLAYYWGKLKE